MKIISQDQLSDYTGRKKVRDMDSRVTNIIATKEELLILSKFIAEVANQMPDKPNGYFHQHYRDWKDDWTKKECDIILIQETED